MLGSNFEDMYNLSISNPEKVWDELAKDVVWNKLYTSVIKDRDSAISTWFDGGEINMSYNCLDRHVIDGYGDDLAVIYECPIIHTTEKVELLAGVMVDKCNVKKGDHVLLYFPVTIQGLVAMLACTRIGAIYIVVFSGFLPDVLAEKIKQTEPKLIITTNKAYGPGTHINYKDQVDEAIKICQFSPVCCIVYNRPNTEPAEMVKGKDLDWETEIKTSTPHASVSLESNHPMFIIYTSGTIGEPKALVVGTGNSVVTGRYLLKYVGGLKRKECFWMLSNFGWISGQMLMVYGPLLVGGTIILYEGEPVTKQALIEVANIINRNNVVSFGTIPNVFQIMKMLCSEADIKLPYKHLKVIYVGGESSTEDLRKWISKIFSCSTYNVWGQSEVGCVVTGTHFEFKRPNYDKCLPIFSINPKIINSTTGEHLPNETIGRIVFKTPICPSAALTIYKNHQMFLDLFFTKYPGYYDTMDYGMIMNDGSLQVLSRSESIIEISSTCICGVILEEACLTNEYVLKAAFVPMNDPITGNIPFAFLEVKKDKPITNNELIKDIIDIVTKKMGTFICFRNAIIVPELPKNKTGKLMRTSLSEMVNGKKWKIPTTINNPQVYNEIYDLLIKAGYKASLPIDN